MRMFKKSTHGIIEVADEDNNIRKVCKCQVKKKHKNQDGSISFPVYECPELTHSHGFGTQTGI